MRIISQNGKFDVPYEMCAVICENTMIYAKSPFGEQWLFAEYSTPDKAQNTMDMLHQEYTGIMPSLMIDKGANFNPEDMEALKKSLTGAIVGPAKQGDVKVHMLPRIFRFPDDEEIEVEE